MPKNAKIYICENCDFNCCKQSNYNKHILTSKHKMLTNIDTKNAENAEKYMCDCGKEYSHRQSLSVHKKKCTFIKETLNENINQLNKDTNIDINDKNLMLTLIQQNNNLQQQMLEVIKNGTNINNTINNNSHNKTFNLQVFLHPRTFKTAQKSLKINKY